MVMSILLLVGCLVGLIILVGVGVGVYMVIQAGKRDTVSTAREDWIQRRSDKDEQDLVER